MKKNEGDEIIKIVLIGEANVGKTSIICQFMEKVFQDDVQSTVGGAYNCKTMKCDNKRLIKLEIWDTAGQEHYRCVTKMFYKNADVAMLIYDITNYNSFEELKNYWVDQVLEASPKNVMLAIVANKSDLFEIEQVNEDEARKFAKNKNAAFFVVSAKDNNSVNDLFKAVVKKYSGANEVYLMEEGNSSNNFKKSGKEVVKVNKNDLNTKKKKSRFC